MLIVSGFWLITGLISSLAVYFMIPMIQQQSRLPDDQARTIGMVMAVVTSIVMVVLPAIFLAFYLLPSVKATCLARSAGARPLFTTPVPVIILTCLYGLGVLGPVSFFWMKAIFVFGFILHGPIAFLLTAVFSVLSGVCAWLVYKRRFAGWAISLGIALYGIVSTIIMYSRYDIAQIYREMGIDPGPVGSQWLFQKNHFWLFNVPWLLAWLGFVIYVKRYFPKAGLRSESQLPL